MGKENSKSKAIVTSKAAFKSKLNNVNKTKNNGDKLSSGPEKSKFPKRIKRNDLLAQKEKLKMLNKYKKTMRKERMNNLKTGDTKAAAAIPYPKNLSATYENNQKKMFMTSNKKAQNEYKIKLVQKEKDIEVICSTNKILG